MEGIPELDDSATLFELKGATASALGGDRFVLQLEGRWLSRERPALRDAELLVDENRRQHRFPAAPAGRRSVMRSAAWSVGFTLPMWLAPRLEGNTFLRVGELTIPLPEGTFARLDVGPNGSEGEASRTAESRTTAPAASARQNNGLDPGRSAGPAPSADPASDQVVAALRAELERRAGGEAAILGQLTEAQAELKAQAGVQTHYDQILGELRQELDELRELVQRRAEVESRAVVLAARVEELEADLADTRAQLSQVTGEVTVLQRELANRTVARDAAESEAAALRNELERIGTELATARDRRARNSGGVADAEALLREARALRAQMVQGAAQPAVAASGD